ncbi:hypothetical protein [Streptomyces sp. WAC01280]|uniref:hypothetical protein n=1 Tax=Streptomyces sp. WAC01280 TaxID=2487424 RepID=UPI000F7AC943|nr:hypothetical protein [Streptomyces sp. WAC01280]RSS57450.1 hypothetical protein EF909_16010 [Streptomyces sp. WAC01280]
MPGNQTPTLITSVPVHTRAANDSHLSPVAALGLIAVFAVLGTVLTLAGMALGAIVQLLLCCAAIGAVTAAAVAGGRRLAALLSSAMSNPQ